MTVHAFNYARVPPIYFGAGKLQLLPTLAGKLGASSLLLVIGGKSLRQSGKDQAVRDLLDAAGIKTRVVSCDGEPTAAFVDRVCAEHRGRSIDLVVGIGGGSVVDAGKAISAMLPHDNSIFDHLEGVGRGVPHSGEKTPYIAVPTTSGTGSEVTKNAVISEVGPQGYKKSLRHDNLVPDAVIVDGELLVSCPRDVTVACGMDAVTQLMEPYLSPSCSPMTEALAWSGLEAIKDSLLPACGANANNVAVREKMAYASLLSGVALANDGLGIVHGLASPIGGYFPVPHGVVCATLMGAAARANLKALRDRDPQGPAIAKMARIGELLDGHSGRTDADYCDALVSILDEWTTALDVPRLGRYGIRENDLDRIVEGAANRNNPIALSREEIRELLLERL